MNFPITNQQSASLPHTPDAFHDGKAPTPDDKGWRTVDVAFLVNNKLRADVAQGITFSAAVVLITVLVAYKLLHVYHILTRFDFVHYQLEQNVPDAEDDDVLTDLDYFVMQYPTAIMIDLFIHVVMLMLIYIITIVALLYMGSVGKMIGLFLGLTFLEELDDMVKRIMIEYSDLGSMLFKESSHEDPNKMASKRMLPMKGKAITISLIGFALLSVFVLAVGMWGLLFTAIGCKPGLNNEFDFW